MIIKIIGFVFFTCIVMTVQGQENKFIFSAGTSLDINKLQWSIAGNTSGQNPNILSELIFKSVTSVGYYVDGTYKPFKPLDIHLFFKNSFTIGGNGTDTDYGEDNRADPTYNLSFTSNRGNIKQFRGGGMYHLSQKRKVDIALGADYETTTQLYYITNSTVPDLKSTYETKWKGLWLRASVNYNILPRLGAYINMGYGINKYEGRGNWNTIDAFQHPLSFLQQANGNGLDATLGCQYKLSSLLNIDFSSNAGRLKTSKGTDNAYLSDGTTDVTQFNVAKNTYLSFKIGAVVFLSNRKRLN